MSSTISNSNYYSVSASSNNGIAGLVSGMDTDSMVKQMLSGTQAKIDAKKQEKQQLEWKQEQYQDVIESINGFSSKYFDTSYGSTLSTNLASTDLFNSMVSSVTSGSSVKIVSTGTSAATGETRIRVDRLASATKLQSSVKMSGNQTITGTGIDADSFKERLNSGSDFSIDLTLDGVKKTITLSKSDFQTDGAYDATKVTADNIAAKLEAKTQNAFGSYISFSNDGGKVTFGMNIKAKEIVEGEEVETSALENGHELTITGADANYLGITPGASTLVSGQTKLGAIAGVTGDTFKFSINGTDFEFSADTTVSKMMNTINSSNAGVKMSYSSMTDSFAIEQSSTGAGYDIDLQQDTGNLLSRIFGSSLIAEGTKAKSTILNGPSIAGELASDYSTSAASMKINVNGADYTFSISSSDGSKYSKSDIETAFNKWLKDKFGEKENGTANISYSDGSLNTAEGYAVSFAKSTNKAETDLAVAFGFASETEGKNNNADGNTDIDDFESLSSISFLKADGTAASKLSEITSISYNGSSIAAEYKDGRLQLTTQGTFNFGDSVSGNAQLKKLFGANVTVGTGAMAAESSEAYKAAYSDGTDAKVVINGVETTRASNTFSFDGITVTATAISAEETVIGTTRDTDKIISTIKSFVEDYNTLIKDLYGRVTQDADYRNYKPLTTEQEDEMSDKEIELWTEKAKKGLLRSDTDINSFIDAMRTAVYTKSESAGIALYSIGIESESWNGAGELVIDEDMLRTAVESDPEAIAALFTDKTSGVAATLSKACDTAAKVSSAGTGTLVVKAGAKNYTTGAKNNDIYWDLSRIDDRLDYLNDLYQSEKTRYWQQFTSMETIMSQYSSQSSMLTNMFS